MGSRFSESSSRKIRSRFNTKIKKYKRKSDKSSKRSEKSKSKSAKRRQVVEIVQLYHNIQVTGYQERQKMTELITRNYQQLGIIKKYVNEYDMYQRMKNCREVLKTDSE